MNDVTDKARVNRGPTSTASGPVKQAINVLLVLVEESVPAFLMAAMVLIIVVDVVGRYVFSRPIEGAAELATSMFLGIIFLAGAGAMRRHLHVNIDALVVRLPTKLRAAAYILTNVTMAVGLLILVPVAWHYAIENRRIILLLQLPQKYIFTVIVVGYLLIAMHALVNAVEAVLKLRCGTFVIPEADMDFGVDEDMTPIFIEGTGQSQPSARTNP